MLYCAEIKQLRWDHQYVIIRLLERNIVYWMNITTTSSSAWTRKACETSEQRSSTPTPTNSDAPNGAEPNSEDGTEKGPNKHDLRKKKEIPIEAKRDPPPPAKAPWKTSIRMDFIKERPECDFQFGQCHNLRGVQHGVFQICSDRMFPSMHHGLLRISCGRYWWVPLENL